MARENGIAAGKRLRKMKENLRGVYDDNAAKFTPFCSIRLPHSSWLRIRRKRTSLYFDTISLFRMLEARVFLFLFFFFSRSSRVRLHLPPVYRTLTAIRTCPITVSTAWLTDTILFHPSTTGRNFSIVKSTTTRPTGAQADQNKSSLPAASARRASSQLP